MLPRFDLVLDALFVGVSRSRYSQEVLGAECLDHLSHLHDKLEYDKSQLSPELVWLLRDVLFLIMQLKVDHLSQELCLLVQDLNHLASHILGLDEVFDITCRRRGVEFHEGDDQLALLALPTDFCVELEVCLALIRTSIEFWRRDRWALFRIDLVADRLWA